MANILIKRKVTLDFLGEEYKDSYLVFKAVPVVAYNDLIARIDSVSGNQESMAEIIKILEEYFVDGVFNNEKVLKEDIKQFDGDTMLRCFETLTGQTKNESGGLELDPKDVPSSTTTSTTEAVTATK